MDYVVLVTTTRLVGEIELWTTKSGEIRRCIPDQDVKVGEEDERKEGILTAAMNALKIVLPPSFNTSTSLFFLPFTTLGQKSWNFAKVGRALSTHQQLSTFFLFLPYTMCVKKVDLG